MKNFLLLALSVCTMWCVSGEQAFATKTAPQLPIQITASTKSVAPQSPVEFLVHIPNKSASSYWGVTATVQFPAELTCTGIVSANRAGCSFSNNQLRCYWADYYDWWVTDIRIACVVPPTAVCGSSIPVTASINVNKPAQNNTSTDTVHVACVNPTATPTPLATVTPVATSTPIPTSTPVVLPSATPTPVRTATPVPTNTPTPAVSCTPPPCQAPNTLICWAGGCVNGCGFECVNTTPTPVPTQPSGTVTPTPTPTPSATGTPVAECPAYSMLRRAQGNYGRRLVTITEFVQVLPEGQRLSCLTSIVGSSAAPCLTYGQVVLQDRNLQTQLRAESSAGACFGMSQVTFSFLNQSCALDSNSEECEQFLALSLLRSNQLPQPHSDAGICLGREHNPRFQEVFFDKNCRILLNPTHEQEHNSCPAVSVTASLYSEGKRRYSSWKDKWGSEGSYDE